MNDTNQVQIDALAQLRKGQLLIEQGRREIEAANKKIQLAQLYINESATALRITPVVRTLQFQ